MFSKHLPVKRTKRGVEVDWLVANADAKEVSKVKGSKHLSLCCDMISLAALEIVVDTMNTINKRTLLDPNEVIIMGFPSRQKNMMGSKIEKP